MNDGIDCDDCNYDTHICKGCGEPIKHGMWPCAACAALAEAEEVLHSVHG